MIPPVIDINDLKEIQLNPKLWTAVIPAAGSGTRLGYHRAKILYPLMGRPILDWLVDALEAVAQSYVFILSPNGRHEVEEHLQRRIPGRYKIAIQETPTGMGDAVLLAEPLVLTPYALVVWGDQVTINPHTLRVCATLHQQRAMATLTLPSLIRRNPYINLMRDKQERIVGVNQARENEIQGEFGENDCGLFLFTAQTLFRILGTARQKMTGIGDQTSEFNLLPILPNFEYGAESVCTVRIHDINETLGINTVEEGELVAKVLRERGLPFG